MVGGLSKIEELRIAARFYVKLPRRLGSLPIQPGRINLELLSKVAADRGFPKVSGDLTHLQVLQQ
jgi:hypothetical protein